MIFRNDFTRMKWLAGLGTPAGLFFMLLVLHLLPIWLMPFFPTQDGPVHVHTASVLRYYFDPDFSVFQEYYALRRSFDPNWIGQLLMGSLMYFFSPLVAEKLLLSLYVITLPLSIYYVLLAINKHSIFLALLAFPFIYNYSLHMGFYNFCLSLSLFFFLLGYWLRHYNALNTAKILILSLLTLVLYFSHLVSLAAAGITLASLVLWGALVHGTHTTGSFSRKTETVWTDSRQGFLALVIVFLPAGVLLAEYVFRNWGGTSVLPSIQEIISRFINLGGGSELVSYSYREVWPAVALHLIIFGLSFYILFRRFKERRIQFGDGFLIAAVIFLSLYLFLPSGMLGGTILQPRLALYIFLLLILWLGTETYSPRLRWGVQAATVVIAVGLLSLNTAKYWQLQPYFAEYASVKDKVEPNRVLLPLNFSPWGQLTDEYKLSTRVQPFLHAQGYVTAMANLVDLDNYQAATNYFLIKWAMPGNERNVTDEEGHIDFGLYEKRSGKAIDYVLLAGMREDHRTKESVKALFEQLADRYELIHVSSPTGFAQLYRRSDFRHSSPR